jgi:hypothetical protein
MSTTRRTFLKLMGLGVGAAVVAPKVVLGVEPSGELARHWVGYPSRKLGCGFGSMALNAQEYIVRPEFEKDTNPHEAFLKASIELQRILGEVAHQRLLEVPEPLRRNVELVTSVLMPVHARAVDGPGFEVVADCAIQVRGYGSIRNKEDRDEWRGFGSSWTPPDMEVYSKTGEYPVEIPSNLDIGYLMSTSSDWLSQRDDNLLRRMAHIKVVEV